jgi:hypothetical protein
MKTKFSVALALIFCFLYFSSVEAQSALKNDKIPDDLLITLKRQEPWSGPYSELTITANGDWFYHSRGGLPIRSLPNVLSLDGKRIKPPKYLKPKLSHEKLKLLIAEFEKIQFFKFGEDFPQEEEKETLFLTDQAKEVISIRINGQIKEVSNDLGGTLKRTRLLHDLAEKIRDEGIWNYENGEIPDNFQVSYRITDEDKIKRDFKIESNGKVTESIFSTEPVPNNTGKTYSALKKTKTVGKLTRQQLTQLIDEFEKIGFSTFRYSILSKYDGCLNEPVSAAEKRTHISVQINYAHQMYASLYENCNPKLETNSAKFEYMNEVITKLLKNIHVTK